MDIIKLIKKKKSNDLGKALVFGMGGGGDIVATIPTAFFLKEFGYHIYFGSIIWDRYVVDPEPGPRAIEELESCRVINDTVAIANPKTRTKYGVELTISRAAKSLGDVIALDITKGPSKLAKGIRDFMEKEEISLVIGVDSGGDVISMGFESGVKSPLADAVSLASLSLIEDSVVGVFGFGSDGELRIEEILYNMSLLMKDSGFLGCASMGKSDFEKMEELTGIVTTEASKIPIEAFKGEFKLTRIRDGRTVLISPLSVLTFYFDPRKVIQVNKLAKSVVGVNSVEEAKRILNDMGIFTEMDFEYLIDKGSKL